ncbi:NAD(P)-dependent oxidoreductase [Halothiobacillus sp. DCM-1]|uniref:NAD(P)-dependent oxidoreductase n=1 Tax=Halothiobacillus sp. DCM-1 TaxID=3112558 RepID=UPI00325447BB
MQPARPLGGFGVVGARRPNRRGGIHRRRRSQTEGGGSWGKSVFCGIIPRTKTTEERVMHIAVIGLGLMGRAIAQRLQCQGLRVTGYNRSPGAPLPGVAISQDLAEALAGAEVVWVMLADAAACTAVLCDHGQAAGLAGKTILNGATIAPAQSRALATSLTAAGAQYLETPVLGSTPQAQDGSLQILVGGDPAVFAAQEPLLRLLGVPTHFGAIGQGAAVKLAMNQLIGSLTAAFSMSLGLVQREGVAVAQFMDTLRQSALYAPTFDKKLARMEARAFVPANFPLKHLQKDLRLFTEAAAERQIDTRLLQTLSQVLDERARAGHADEDYSTLFAQFVPPEG